MTTQDNAFKAMGTGNPHVDFFAIPGDDTKPAPIWGFLTCSSFESLRLWSAIIVLISAMSLGMRVRIATIGRGIAEAAIIILSPVAMDEMFELFDNKLLITDNTFHHVANRNYTD
jgi:hypothetical protein